MGFLTMLDHIAHVVYAKMAKKINEQNPWTLPKIRQPISAYTSYFFWFIPAKKVPPPIVFRAKLKAAKAKEKKE